MLTHRKIVMPSIIQQHANQQQNTQPTIEASSSSTGSKQTSTCNGVGGQRRERERESGTRKKKQILSDTICILVRLPQASNE